MAVDLSTWLMEAMNQEQLGALDYEGRCCKIVFERVSG